MDIVSQLQDHTNHIAFLLFNTVGTLQRDATPSTIPGKPLPAPTTPAAPAAAAATPSQPGNGQPVAATGPGNAAAGAGISGAGLTGPAAAANGTGAPGGAVGPGAAGNDAAGTDASVAAAPAVPVIEQVPEMASALVQALKLFDMLVDALPPDIDLTEEEQLERIAELNAENEAVAKEMAAELDGVEEDLTKVRRLFKRVVDGCLQNPSA
ncbi:hypothetical protein CLOM_g18286 [Closterium sp. NIES-68]|nr:hypothetical protein CLOM_g18286 [Closterium sp. NIES-68]GJP63447.1 hypothetical protein CLOP_g20525 [Closterium sp. NIES-67]